ncbi:TPR-like protein [Serendipita vermifera]|nr:TPR-like protein [Serendipita vermifera]
MQRLEYDTDSDDELRPCDWFDMIMGTGTGGILAILLGRLRMKSSEALDAYRALHSSIATQPAADDEERASNTNRFLDAFKKLLEDVNVPLDTIMRSGKPGEDQCQSVVCVLNRDNLTACQFIRSYRSRGQRAPDCTVLQAACAAIASPDRYLPVNLGTDHNEIVYFDATPGYANPAIPLLKEAEHHFGKDADVATIISVGSGKPDIKLISPISDNSQMNDILKRLSADTERVHEEMQERLKELAIYFRFNVERGVGPETNLSLVQSYTQSYLEEGTVSQKLDEAVKTVQSRTAVKRLQEISNSVQMVTIKYKPRPSVVPFFIGRRDILDNLRKDHLSDEKARPESAALPLISVLSGLGGSGKTQISLQFASEYEASHSEPLVFFMDGSSEDKLKGDLEAVIRSRGPAFRSSTYEDALGWLASEATEWLLIIDNVDDPSLNLFPYLPKCSHGHIIITSRDSTRASLSPDTSYQVGSLDLTAATDMILNVSHNQPTAENKELAKAVATTLGCLPLALAQAAGYIFVHKCLHRYLNLYEKSKAQLLARKATHIPQDYDISVATTLQMSLDRLPQASKELLYLFSYYDISSIAEVLVSISAGYKFFYPEEEVGEADRKQESAIRAQSEALMSLLFPSGEWLEFDFNDLLQPCLHYSLIQITGTPNQGSFYSMHVLVQTWLQLHMITIKDQSTKDLSKRLLISDIILGPAYVNLRLNQLLFPHLRLIAGSKLGISKDEFAVYYALDECGDYAMGIEHLKHCLEIQTRELGEDHPDTLNTMSNLANSYAKVGNQREMMELHERVLRSRRSLLGEEHRSTVTSMAHLAVAYHQAGKTQQAVELEEKALPLAIASFGEEHPAVLTSMSNLAAMYSELGRDKEAVQLNEKIWGIRKRVLGEHHPSTLTSMNNLAAGYGSIGRTEEAYDLSKRVTELRKEIHGPDHPNTLASMVNWSTYSAGMDLLDEAIEIMEEVIEKSRQVHGEDSQQTLAFMRNLAHLYGKAGRQEEALALSEGVLAMEMSILDEDHPSLAISMNNLASYYLDIDRFEEAEDLQKQALAIHQKAFGNDHPRTHQIMSNLSETYKKAGKYREYAKIAEQIVDIVGMGHPMGLIMLGEMANAHMALGEYEQALELRHTSLALRRQILGDSHPLSVMAIKDLAEIYQFVPVDERAESVLAELSEAFGGLQTS